MSWVFKTSQHAALNVRYRPEYLKPVYDRILPYLEERLPSPSHKWRLAVDVGCGSGQNTLALVEHFDRVVGVDISGAQLEDARTNSSKVKNVSFREAEAHKMEFFSDGSVDLVTAATALHWFDIEQFYRECRRVLRPGGVLADFCYQFEPVDSAASNIFKIFLEKSEGSWKNADGLSIEPYQTLYRDFSKSFSDTRAISSTFDMRYSVSSFIELLRTLSPPSNPVSLEDLFKKLHSIFSTASVAEPMIIKVSVGLLLGRK